MLHASHLVEKSMTKNIPDEAEALRQQRDFSTSLLNTAPVIVLLLDTRGMIEYANPYFEQLSGYRLDEIRGREWFSTFLPARDQDNIRALFQQAAHDVPTRGNINPIVTRSGAELEIEWYSQIMRDAQGNIISVLNTGQDVTARRVMEKALHFSAARLNEAQHLARLGSWELNLVTGELLWSDEVFSLFEIEKNQFGNSYANFLSVIHPDDRESVNLAYTRSLETRSSYEITHRLCMPDGRIKWMHERCITEFDAMGNALRSLGTVQDVTERQLAQAALQQLNEELEQRVAQRTAELLSAKDEAERANSAKSEFLTRMSYQLRTPMNGILGFTQLLAYDTTNSLDMQQADYVQEILRSGEHLLKLINNVLDLARIESGNVEFVQEPVPDLDARQVALASARTVLYIEDNPSSVRLVQQSIGGRIGLAMLSAHSAELGLEMARARRPDIILLDINLPGMNGFEALGILQNDTTTRDIPVIAITANAMERDIKKGLDAGFVDYLTKPLDIIQLVLVLSRLAERQRAAVSSKH